jgi:hypothetical protein
MLAYYVEWHLRRGWTPLLFDDHEAAQAQAARTSVVATAQRSAAAKRKARTKTTAEGWPVHSFQSLLGDLATIIKNRVEPIQDPRLRHGHHSHRPATESPRFARHSSALPPNAVRTASARSR